MNTKTILTFIAGVVTGSVITYFNMKQKFEERTNEEIESVRKMYKHKIDKLKNELIEPENKKTEQENTEKVEEKTTVETTENYRINNDELTEYEKQLDKYGYADIEEIPTRNLSIEERMEAEPEIIPPDSYGEFDNYTLLGYMFYADDVLTDENDEPIDDFEDIVGDEFRHLFHNDMVYVRNDRLQIDYEIMRVSERYHDTHEDLPFK